MRPTVICRVPIVLAALVVGSSAAVHADEQAGTIAPAPPPAAQGVFKRAIDWGAAKLGDATGGDGFYPELGHMVPGAGLIKGGPGYRRHLFDGRAVVNASAAVSSRRYSMAHASVEWPDAFGSGVALGASADYADSTQVSYFGIGAAARREARTNYRITSVDASGSSRVRIGDGIVVTGTAGLLTRLSVAPGLGSATPSIEQRFDDRTAPGLSSAPQYVHGDVTVEHDSRDRPGYPTRGGIYRITASSFHDAGRSSQSFRRFDADAVHYLPLRRDASGLTLHGRVTLSQAAAGGSIPFYLLPTLGGQATLRGYSDYRFRDRNAAVLNVEYRWRLVERVDAAMFTDVGTVAPSPGDLLHQPRAHDYGAGVRLHSATRMIGRLDVARSPEGTRFAVSVTAPFGTSRRAAIVPYVP